MPRIKIFKNLSPLLRAPGGLPAPLRVPSLRTVNSPSEKVPFYVGDYVMIKYGLNKGTIVRVLRTNTLANTLMVVGIRQAIRYKPMEDWIESNFMNMNYSYVGMSEVDLVNPETKEPCKVILSNTGTSVVRIDAATKRQIPKLKLIETLASYVPRDKFFDGDNSNDDKNTLAPPETGSVPSEDQFDLAALEKPISDLSKSVTHPRDAFKTTYRPTMKWFHEEIMESLNITPSKPLVLTRRLDLEKELLEEGRRMRAETSQDAIETHTSNLMTSEDSNLSTQKSDTA